jgi:hypothetical protein
MHKREDIKARLRDLLESQNHVLAAWEGGSAATGYLDQFSDLDLIIVTDSEDTNPIFQLLQDHFREEYGIRREYRVPEPAWHGMSQCFYLLADCDDFFYCDIAVVACSNPNKFTEPDRHGKALLWFDKDQQYRAEQSPSATREALVKRMLSGITAVDFLSIIELQKAIARDNWIAAQMNYHTLINRYLVPLLNIKYRPEKADFGIRYADRDYPPGVVSELEALLCITSVADIRVKSSRALKLYDDLKTELVAQYLDTGI